MTSGGSIFYADRMMDFSLESPISGKTYAWRIVDFDISEKNNRTTEALFDTHLSYLERLLGGLPKGYVLEPWD